MRIFLSGPMGSGKSTVARAVGARHGLPVVDLDARIAERAGQSIEEIFRRRGEGGFRALEREVLERVLSGGGDLVVALGGGTVTDRRSRQGLLSGGTLITLAAPVEELTGRVAQETGRPLLAGGDARQVLVELVRDRAAAYAECHGVIDTAGRAPDELADAAVALARRELLVVPLGERTYRVDVSRGARRAVGAEALAAATGRRALVVSDTGTHGPWGEEAAEGLRAAGFEVVAATLPAGEAHKTLESVEHLWDAALAGGLDRDSLVLAVGGGVVGDLAGFAAATLLRGVAFAQLPTSLLAMVDSAVGGKTGFDRPQGKNLIGAFHQPRFVACDVEVLETLPAEERVAGLAEVVKAAWLEGEEAVSQLERDATALREGDAEATERAVRMAVALKARIVTEDEREGGARRLLNLGHTVGHALEAAAGYRGLRHGEAVALGMVAAFRVAEGLGRGEPRSLARLTSLLRALGLPTDLEGRLDARTLGYLATDKKRAADRVRFVVPGAPGATEVIPVALSEVTRWLVPM